MSIRTKVYPKVMRDGINGQYESSDYSATPTIVAEFDGAVFCDRERNYYDDSDGYSHVIDATGQLREWGTWTTRAGTNHVSTSVDAYANEDPEFIAVARAAHIEKLVAIGFMLMKRNFEDAEHEALTPQRGMTLKVVKGRKVPVGTVGECIWTGERSYSQWQAKYGSANLRVGIKDADGGVHWTDASNVEIVNPVMPDAEDYFDVAGLVEKLNALDLRTLHANYCSAAAGLAGLIRAGRY